MELIKINAADYGLQEKTAKNISDTFKPMLDKMVELENEFNDVMARKIDPETIDMATELLNKYVKVRTGTAEIHKGLKRFYLQGGRFVDGWKNAQIMASEGKEQKLMEIKKHYENIERERQNDLHNQREKELLAFDYDAPIIPGSLGIMADEVWNNYKTGAKLNFEAKQKAEADRIENERIFSLGSGRLTIISRYSRYFQEAYTPETLGELTDKGFKNLTSGLKKLEDEDNKEQAKIQAENKRLQTEAMRIQKIADTKFKVEQAKAAEQLKAANAIIETEQKAAREFQSRLNAKIEFDNKAEQDRIAAVEAEAKKGDAAKINDLITDLKALATKYEFKSKANKILYKNTGALLDKVITYINSKK